MLPKLPDSPAAFNDQRALLRGCRGHPRRVVLAGLVAAATMAALPAAPGEALLEPDQAFRPGARFVPGEVSRVEVTYRLAPGYYLYRDRFRVASQPPLPTGDLELPAGEEIDDPFVGRTRIFRHSVSFSLPLTASVPPGIYRLRITAQGCAEERFCFRPFQQELQVRVPRP